MTNWLSCFSPVSLAGGLLCCSPSTISAQELQAKITINHAQISGTEKGVFDNLQQTLQQFVNNRQWTHLQFQKNERIICNFNITVTKYDRLARSLRDLLDIVDTIQAQGAGFRSLAEDIDTTTPAGRLVFHVFAALAEFERDLIRERTHAGLAAARARGRKGGRPPALSPDQVKAARRMYEQNEMTVAQIGAVLGVSRATIYRALNRNSAPMVQPRQSRSAV